jgi:hypothetical protein
MGPRKNEGRYLGYEEHGNGQLQSVQNFQLTTTTLRIYVKDWQESLSEAIKQNWVGRKFFFVNEKKIWLSNVF